MSGRRPRRPSARARIIVGKQVGRRDARLQDEESGDAERTNARQARDIEAPALRCPAIDKANSLPGATGTGVGRKQAQSKAKVQLIAGIRSG